MTSTGLHQIALEDTGVRIAPDERRGFFTAAGPPTPPLRPTQARTLRLLNVVLSAGAAFLAILAGRRLFGTERGKTYFTILAVAFPKAPVVGGLINNDNLALLAGSLVFAGLVFSGPARRSAGRLLLGLGLAVAGWVKLTALVAFGAAAFAVLLLRTRDDALDRRTVLAFAAGGALGSLPYLETVMRTGHLLYVNTAQFFVPVGLRPDLGFAGYVAYFVQALALKWPAVEFSNTRPWVALGLLSLIGAATVFGLFVRKAGRPLALGYTAATVVFFAIHLWFGWNAFRDMGDMTIAQTRYYAVLWPGLAVSLAGGCLWLARRRPALAAGVITLTLLPTVAGSIVMQLMAG